MLITQKIEIKINKNVKYFNTLGYNVKCGDIINIEVKNLPKNSHHKVLVKCDICGKEKEICYREYLRQNNLHNFDTCKKCSIIKNKTTNNIKYGVEYITQSTEFKNKIKKTKIEKYGDSAYNNIEKTKKTNLEKYNTEYSFLNTDVKEKIKKTNLEKFGFENNLQNSDIRLKIENTNVEKYGVKNPFQSEIIKSKIRNTNIEKLGVPYPTMSKLVIDKSLQTNINNGRWIKIEDRSDFYNYYLFVYKYTLKNKKELLEKWNGCDYYTNEYILENFKLDSNNKKYPTIDHKISTRYGFDNNIPYDNISKIENLCITTRSNNSAKSMKNESEFIKNEK
jgi:hypothetical protein